MVQNLFQGAGCDGSFRSLRKLLHLAQEAAATLGKGASEADIKKMAKPEQEVGIEAMKPCVS